MSNTDKFLMVGIAGSATTLQAPGHTIGGGIFNVVSTNNWSTTTGVAFAVDRISTALVSSTNPSGQVPGSYTEWIGDVTGSTTITGAVLSPYSPNSDQNYPAGATTRVYIPVSATVQNKLVTGVLTQHNQDGTHKPFVESNIVPTSAIQDSSVTASKLSTSAIKLGKAQITNQITTGSTSNVQATGLSVSVTVPSGGRSVKITFSCSGIGNANSGQACAVNIWDGAVGSGTLINEHSYISSAGGQTVPDTMIGEHTPSAGAHTYNIGYRASGGTAAIAASTNGPALILVELI